MNTIYQKPQPSPYGRRNKPPRQESGSGFMLTAALLLFVGAGWLGIEIGQQIKELVANPGPAAHSGQTVADGSQQTTSGGAVINATLPATGVWTDGAIEIPNPDKAVTIERHLAKRVSFYVIAGGSASARRCLTRRGVSDFVKDAGAAAGLNGTFFANASLNGTDNALIGPSMCGDETTPVFGAFDRRPSLKGRPLVFLSASRCKIVPYDPASMDNETAIRSTMADATDVFLGGVWLVHNGVSATEDQMDSYHVHDANDYRRRAFFAIMMDGRPALGATDCCVSSKMLCKALAASGVREAILLDSGFSTSLVFGPKVLVSGHSTPTIPSRPVPQAIMLFGKVDTAMNVMPDMTATTNKPART